MFKHILLPTDGSRLSEAAIFKGIELARQHGARVTGIHAMPEFHLLSYRAAALDESHDHFAQDAQAHAQRYLDFVRRLYAPGVLSHALARPLAYEPGSRFQYSNIDSHLLALALARRLKVPLAEFAQEVLFRPLGIHGAEWPPGHDGVPNGAAELRLTAPELLRIGQMMLAGGSWEGRQLVPAAFVREATTRKIASDIPPRGRPELWGYGYLWWLSSTPADELPAYNASGFGGQFIYVVPALEVVVVALTEQISRAVARQTATIIREAALPAAR